jgi:phage terminase Nu1 subunit (DNA packaging protein)
MAETVDLQSLTVTRQELATLLGLSSARIGQMVGEGTIPAPVGHGRYLLAQCVKRFCEYSRADSKSKGNKAFTDARAQWMASRARRAQLEEEVLNDRFITVEAMNIGWQAIGTVMRTNYLRVPSRLASRFAEFKTPQELFDAAMEEINTVLEALYTLDVNTIEWEGDDEAAA